MRKPETPFNFEVWQKSQEIDSAFEEKGMAYVFLLNELLYCTIEHDVITPYQVAFLALFFERIDIIASVIKVHIEQFFKEQNSKGGDPNKIFPGSIKLPDENSTKWVWKMDTLIDGNSGPKLHFYFNGWKIKEFKVIELEKDESDLNYKAACPRLNTINIKSLPYD